MLQDLKIVPGAFVAAIILAIAGYAEAPAFPAPAKEAGFSAASAPAMVSGSSYTLDTPLDEIVATQAGEAVIRKNIPGLLENTSYPMFHAMSLNLLASLSGGRLTARILARTQTDLAALPATASRPSSPSPLRQVAQYADPDFN